MARSFLGGEFAGGESAWWRGNWIPMRYPFWISNSTEAENCTKKQTIEQINLLLENSKFLQLQSCKIFVSKLCIRSKNTIMVIINDVFSPNCICTYQERNHTSMHFSFSSVFMNK